MKLTKLMTSVCMIWTIVSLYQSATNMMLISTTSRSLVSSNDDNAQQERRGRQNAFLRTPGRKYIQHTKKQNMLSNSVQQLVRDAIHHANDTNSMNSRRTSRSFPRWGTTVEEENQNGIDIRPLMDFIVNSSVVAYARKQDKFHPNYIATTDHSDAVGKWFPEVLYVIDHRGIYISQRHRNITALELSMVTEKLVPTEKLMNFSVQLLRMNYKYSKKTWPRLTDVLIDNQNPSSSGFPMLFWFGDYTECNYRNWKNKFSIPLYTNAASANCNYSFPFVTYQTGRDSNINWTDVIPQQHERYPWKQKYNKVVWRGGLTGKIVNATQKSPRWNMVQMVHDLQQDHDYSYKYKNKSTETEITTAQLDPYVLDVAATRLPPRHKEWRPSLVHELGGLVDSMEMEDFQKYRGIIDIDGNSWSSRFGRLLCFNSVVLKVEPSWVDYFYFKNGWDHEPKLQPWVHYIPIKADLSDLLEMATFVADPENDEFLMKMVNEANTWCSQNMVRRRISIDILNIWERYIELLDVGNPKWVDEHWKPTKENIFHPSNPLVMDDREIALTMTSISSALR